MIADPTATILSVAMLLDHLGLDKAAQEVEAAVARDLQSRGDSKRSTDEIGDAITNEIVKAK
jgi:3-isopropylmalate dehydrogenase